MIKGNFFSTNIFFEKISYGKVNENENLGNFFRPTFFSKNFPMEKSMKMKILIFREKKNTRRGFTVTYVGGILEFILIWETFFRPTFFSKNFPMEKSMKNENCDFSKKINTRRGFTVTHVGGIALFFSSSLEAKTSAHPSLE